MNQPQIQPVSWYPQPSAYQQAQANYGAMYQQPQLPPQYAYQSQQQARQVQLIGRSVQQADDIRPQEVPMDGSIGYFPVTDLSCIYAKQWTGDGHIATVKYVPEPTQAQPVTQTANDELTRTILQRLDKIQEMLTEKKAPAKRDVAVKE